MLLLFGANNRLENNINLYTIMYSYKSSNTLEDL